MCADPMLLTLGGSKRVRLKPEDIPQQMTFRLCSRTSHPESQACWGNVEKSSIACLSAQQVPVDTLMLVLFDNIQHVAETFMTVSSVSQLM